MLRMEMHNGATVSDWLGTAMTAARCAARTLDDVREGRIPATETALRLARDDVRQALEEIEAVMREMMGGA